MAISVKNRKSFPPLVFAPPLKGLMPLELGTGAWDQKTRMMGLPGRQRSLTITSAFWIQCRPINVMDGRKDGHRDKQRPHLRIASRGKNQLSLTNRATHLCMCYTPNLVVLGRGEPQNWHPLGPRRLGMEDMAEHLKTNPSPICYHAYFGRSSLECSHDRKPAKLGSAGAPPVWGWTVIDLLKTSPLPICVTASNLVVLRQTTYI